MEGVNEVQGKRADAPFRPGRNEVSAEHHDAATDPVGGITQVAAGYMDIIRSLIAILADALTGPHAPRVNNPLCLFLEELFIRPVKPRIGAMRATTPLLAIKRAIVLSMGPDLERQLLKQTLQ